MMLDAPPEDDLLDLFRRYRSTGDQSLRDQLVLNHRWLIERCARRFAHRGEPLDDLVQVAALALVRAIDRYDPDHGAAFTSFAVPTLLGALKRHFRDTTWRVKVPRRSRDALMVVKQAIESLSQKLGRSPTVDEIAAATGLGREAVVDTIAADRSYRLSSIDLTTDSSGNWPIADMVPADDRGSDLAEDRVVVLAAVRRLDARSRRILLWRYYEECTQAEIGSRLGVGQVQVSRLIRQALGELRCALGDERLATPDRVGAA